LLGEHLPDEAQDRPTMEHGDRIQLPYRFRVDHHSEHVTFVVSNVSHRKPLGAGRQLANDARDRSTAEPAEPEARRRTRAPGGPRHAGRRHLLPRRPARRAGDCPVEPRSHSRRPPSSTPCPGISTVSHACVIGVEWPSCHTQSVGRRFDSGGWLSVAPREQRQDLAQGAPVDQRSPEERVGARYLESGPPLST